jgi:Amt family ammonium transporter
MAIDSGATAWILASTALVMIMTPGVGLFYGGLVRKKNFIDMITLSFVAFALVSIQWVLSGTLSHSARMSAGSSATYSTLD